MWLLDTNTLRPNSFTSPEVVGDGYAILSHVWDDEEQSFQDLQRIHDRCKTSGEDPRLLVSPKITNFCAVAARHHYKWAWIDTCCIDKTSSAELSEAINSMFRYYALAHVCYVYLRDVPTDGAFEPIFEQFNLYGGPVPVAPFADSRWHTRGWTLQELIAPRVVLFLSGTWEFLGSKADLADKLHEITRIPATVLRLERPLSEMSVAQRMSWAANRRTTRVEDAAYCLMGLFGVNMPTLYGEGDVAFQRLQEGIIRQLPDTTLFAWIPDPRECRGGLFATSPSDFARSSMITYVTREVTQKKTGITKFLPWKWRNRSGGYTTFTLTPHGVLAHIPIVKIGKNLYGDLSWSDGDCRILLILKWHRNVRLSTSVPVFDIGHSLYDGTWYLRTYDVSVAKYDMLDNATWQDVFFPHQRESVPLREPLYLPLNHGFCPPIRIPERVLASFIAKYRIDLSSVELKHVNQPWSGEPPATVTFRWRMEGFCALQVGRCITSQESSGGPGGAVSSHLWANIHGGPQADACTDHRHDCPVDHILTWPQLCRKFVVGFPTAKIDKTHLGSVRTKRVLELWTFKLTFVQSSSDDDKDSLTLSDFVVVSEPTYADIRK